MGCVSFSLNENQCFVFCLYSHWACSKKKLKHKNMHMQEGALKLLGLVLHASVLAALAFTFTQSV